MSTRTVHFDVELRTLPPGMSGKWGRWLKECGIDPLWIPLGTDLTVDDTRRTITFKRVHSDKQGRRTVTEMIKLEKAVPAFPGGYKAQDDQGRSE